MLLIKTSVKPCIYYYSEPNPNLTVKALFDQATALLKN